MDGSHVRAGELKRRACCIAACMTHWGREGDRESDGATRNVGMGERWEGESGREGWDNATKGRK